MMRLKSISITEVKAIDTIMLMCELTQVNCEVDFEYQEARVVRA